MFLSKVKHFGNYFFAFYMEKVQLKNGCRVFIGMATVVFFQSVTALQLPADLLACWYLLGQLQLEIQRHCIELNKLWKWCLLFHLLSASITG